jgi:HD superfamily phosphohydrolase YqeK
VAAALHEAAAGRLPAWAEAGEARVAHMARVAALLEEWARALRLDDRERARWRAAAWLHDALRDAAPETLRALLPDEASDLPELLLHGPAVARRLEAEGVDDAPLLRAVAYHTLGHPEFDRLGRALYLADFLDPGRDFLTHERAELRARMPHDADRVLVHVVRLRIRHLLDRDCAIRPETCAFWNTLVGRARTT